MLTVVRVILIPAISMYIIVIDGIFPRNYVYEPLALSVHRT